MTSKNIEDTSYHDNPIHAIEFIDEEYETTLVLDIDYISEWLNCEEKYKFKISPAYLSFKNVKNLHINIKKPNLSQYSYLETIIDIKVKKNESEYAFYTIELLGGNTIKFEAMESILRIKNMEFVKDVQYLTKAEREIA